MKTVRSSVLYRIAALLFAVLFLLPILPRQSAPELRTLAALRKKQE